MRFPLLTLGIARIKEGGEIIMGKTVTFSSSSRRSHRQKNPHKLLLAYHVQGHLLRWIFVDS